jgi:methylase of polypeptide subunit release factors
MTYSAISIQGNILSSEILEKIRTEDIRFQKPIDFNLNPSAAVRDEINLAWSLAISNWNAFKQKREALSETDSGVTETRRFWMIPLFTILGYELTTATAELINGKTYAISHRATNKDGFPIHIVGVNQSLDKRPETGGTRISPHALIQEYLNNNEHLYSLVTNGRFLRVLRDATRLSRLSYLEFDLEQMMEEGLYVEFALLFRALHASRMPEKIDAGAESILEFYHQEAISSGSRIRERLSLAVESSIKELANGLLYHPSNENLRQLVLEDKITAQNYYLYTLRLVYRILFLLVIEERKLIYPEKRDEVLNKKRNIYYDFYSLQRLTKLAENLVYVDPRKTDLWQSVLTTFALFEEGKYGQKLDIDPLGSGLFSPSALNIIKDQLLDNECLLKVLRYLVTFENENGQRTRVNYADLDVEEFGSVYEGLLEYDPIFTDNFGQPIFSFVKGDARSSSGSHYTPEELVKPLIVHSLDYLIADKLKEANPEAGLLSLSICDVACGSGHILLSAARRVGFELAKHRSKEDQPTPSAMRLATRDVIKNCIYGVDLNPLAVELCKVALWLEAHEPGQPMNFLDHHIKCGNAIVGLAHFEELENGIASEAFKTLPGDNKDVAAAFKKRNTLERKTKDQLSTYEIAKVDDDLKGVQREFNTFLQLPENTPEQIARKEKAYDDLTKGKKWFRLKQIADLQVAQFFIPKTEENKEKLTTHSQYLSYLKTEAQIIDRGAAMALSMEKHFFHWFLEFPMVFKKGGFDCILGNPPFLGGKKISGFYGDSFLNFLKYNYKPAEGGLDLVTYFFRRIFSIIKEKGFQSLISTKTIYQGDSRIGGLEYILNHSGSINFAIRLMTWPGEAAVEISIITINKNNNSVTKYLNHVKVNEITSRLDSNSESSENPQVLVKNKLKSFVGSVVNGLGFIIKENEISNFEGEVIYPYLSGDDINNDIKQNATRHIINFKNLDDKVCQERYPVAYERIKSTVKPQRDLLNRESYKKLWWQYAEKCSDLYTQIEELDAVLVIPRVSKYINLASVDKNHVFTDKVVVLSLNPKQNFPLIQNSLFEYWAWKYSSTLGSSTINFRPTEAFQTFPFVQNLSIQNKKQLELIGENYQNFRAKLLLKVQLGLTKTYNLFHNKGMQITNLDTKDKQVISIQKHLDKTPDTIDFDEAIMEIVKLRKLHKEMDEAVLEAYGWLDIALRHDFYEVDYLPENDRLRYTIHPEARKEVLKRLLELNHKIHEEEVAAGLWDKKKPVKNEKVVKKKSGNVVNEPGETYGQTEMFE